MSKTLTPTRFHHLNDSRFDLLLAATHWFYQDEDRWIAVAGEDTADWFEETPQIFVDRFLVRDIDDVPSTGTLVYDDSEGCRVEILAAAFTRH